ncbi:putative reverse transcriptase domain-containing protein, partial [Tanacetum coccineum]
MESVFNISGCAIENQGEIKKLEIELWNLKVKGNDVPTYTERFQELTLICTKFVANETEKVDKYISGLPDNIYGNVKSSRPKTLDETIELANDLMDQKLCTYAERQTDNKRKVDDSSRNNHDHQQQPFKRQNVAKVYNMGSGEKKPYGGSLPKYTKCYFHHNARDCRGTGNTNVANAQRNNRAVPKGNGYFECGAPGHFKRDCPKLKNKDGGNGNTQGWVYAVGNAEKNGNASRNPDSNVIPGMFPLNNHYASILFDTGVDRSFISTAFSSLFDIASTLLENSYDVELADGKIVGIDTIIRGCTLNFLNHPFNIDLMPVELGSFDVIIGMDWLRRCHVVIICDERLVRIPYGNETLIFCADERCQIFLAQISAKKEEDKSGGKQLKDVLIVRDFPEVFPEDLLGLPPARPVEFQIDLIPGAAPVARAPYRLAPSKMKELSEQLQELSDKGFIRPSSSPWGALDKKEHEEHLKAILELLKKEKLYAKFSKCEFWIPKVQFLGHIIDSRGIHVDPAKIESIKDWTSPKTPTEISQFLGLAGYYRRFIEGFLKIAKSMSKLIERRWLELLSNYDCDIRYHPGKANVVADALSHKEQIEPLRMEADDQAIQTILLGLPEDIYAAVDSCETAQEIWLRVQQMMKGSDIGIQEKKAKLFNEWERFTSTDGESIESYYHRFSKLMNDFKRNKHFPEKIASNLKFLNNLQPEWSRHVTIVHQTKDLHTTDYTQLYDFLKYNQKEVDDQRAERLAKTHDPLALMANSNNPFNYPVFHQDQPSPSTYMQQPQPINNNYNPQPSFNQNYMQQPMPNPEDITDPTTAMNMALVLMAKAFKLNYSTPTNNNQRISSNPRNRQIAQPGMNMGQDRQMRMVGANGGNQFRQYAGQNVGYQNGYNAVQNVGNQVVQDAVQNQGVQNVGNQNGQIVVPGITNQNPNGNGNVVAARAEGNATGNNGNQIRCYNCRGLGHLARNCTVRPRRRDAAYLQTQLLIAQKEEAGIQLQAEEFDLMAAAADLDEIEEVNANCILMANLQQASTSGTQTDNAPVYDSDGSAEVHNYDNCYDNEIFNMFTQEEQYTELLEPIPEPHQEQQNDSNVTSDISCVEQEGGIVAQYPETVEETRAYFESLYNNLALEVEKVNSV